MAIDGSSIGCDPPMGLNEISVLIILIITEFHVGMFVSEENVDEVVALASEYKTEQLKNKCEEVLLTREASVDLMLTAETFQVCTTCILVQLKPIPFLRRKLY